MVNRHLKIRWNNRGCVHLFNNGRPVDLATIPKFGSSINWTLDKTVGRRKVSSARTLCDRHLCTSFFARID